MQPVELVAIRPSRDLAMLASDFEMDHKPDHPGSGGTKGSTTSRPQSSKSRTFRVATASR